MTTATRTAGRTARQSRSKPTTMPLRLPRLRQDQAAIVKALATSNTVIVACGRRWGKTLMAGTLALHRAVAGGAVAWVVPTYRNARSPWRFAEMHVGSFGELKRSERIVNLGTGRLSIYTADNDVGMRGEAFDLVVVDEAAMIREETYTDVILPTLADRNGRILLISTPKGRNWFWREWQRGKQGEANYTSFQAPTSANPIRSIQQAAAQARERVSDRTYRQEWLAEFVEDGGGVFRGVRAAATVEPGTTKPDATHQYVIGADWGRSNDYTVFTVLDATTRQVVAVDRSNQVEYETQRGRLRTLVDRWKAAVVVAESNAMGQPIIETLSRERIPVRPFTTTNASKAAIIDALALALERGELALLNYEPLIGEMEAFEVDRTPSGLTRYGAPHGMHDDCVMSLALAYSAVGRVNSARGAFG